MERHVLDRRTFCLGVPIAIGTVVAAASSALAAAQEPVRHDLTVKARKYQYSVARIDVAQGDIVVITLVAEDVPHSFAIDEYRIAKRAAPGKPVTFQFRADRAGTFTYYCDLTADEGCKEMRGHLVISTKQP